MARLLLIDDDDPLREVLAATLTAAGHTVIQAANGRKGLACFRAQPADLVITDLVMPEQEGIETIIALHREWPAVPIVAMSGTVKDARLYLETALKLGARRMLAKPFTPDALFRVIAELLPPPVEPQAELK